MEKVKPIVLKMADGIEYTLEFNRKTVCDAESNGFRMRDLSEYPTKFYELFFYSFMMHHKRIRKEETDRIIDEEIGGISRVPEALIKRIIELYDATYSTLSDEEMEEKAKNPQMEILY